MNEKELLLKMSKALKDASVIPDATPLHGQGGLWAMSGLDREIVTAKIEPFGISTVLPVIPSVDENPIFGVVTGIEKRGVRY